MGEVCIANIGPKQRRVRLNFGIVAGVAGVAFVAATIVAGLPSWTRLLAFVPFCGAALGFFQYHEKTWLGLASRSSRDMDQGPELITDEAINAQIRRQVRRVQLKSLAVGVVATVVAAVVWADSDSGQS